MSAMAPMPPGTYVEVSVTDEADPKSPLIATLVMGDETMADPELANSFGASDEAFGWLVRSCAEFHHLEVQDSTGRVVS